MQNIPFLVYTFFSKRKAIFFAFVIAVCALLGYYASKIKLEEDITRFVPRDKNTAVINNIVQALKSKDKIVLHLYSDAAENIDKLGEKAGVLHDSIVAAVPTSEYYAFTYKVSENAMQSVYDIFYNNLPVFLDKQDFSRIEGMLSSDSIEYALQRDYNALLSPTGVVLSKYIRKDPLNLVPIALKKINNIQLDENFETYDGAIVTKDHKHLLMFITPAHAANETALNKNLIHQVRRLTKNLSSNEIKIEAFGAAMVSLGNAEQLRKDTTLTTIITVILIALLIGIYLKNPLPIIFIFLPVGFGMVFSLTMLFLFKGVVSAIAVAAGAAVLGIAINYSLHFFTHYKHLRNVKEVISDLTIPMLIGCTTTVGAFFSLLFTRSEALHDFGIFAAFCLMGALLFSVFVLPHLLTVSFGRQKEALPNHHEKTGLLDKLVSYRPEKSKLVALAALTITIVLSFFVSDVGFESDMNKMSFMDDETKQAEKNLDEVNNFAARSVYIFTTGKSLQDAKNLNDYVHGKLDSLKSAGEIKKFSSISSLFPSDKKQEEKLEQWNKIFTREMQDSVKHRIINSGSRYKFKQEAFAEYFTMLGNSFGKMSKQDADSLVKNLFNEYVGEINGKPSILTHVKVDADKKEKIYRLFSNNENIILFDRQHLTSQFVDVISKDFSTILWITSILVFGFMLISHGRIELAVINFLPMFISWIWILGIMGIAGIKFNIINIIISTFIFGLGDDYSIFIMDGLLNEYKYGKKSLESYKTSIILSALTTIIGIGVLIFAKHPALQSIALITIVGMVCVVLVSFIIQPFLFNWLILDRRKRGLQPFTLKLLMITLFGFIMFTILSFVLTLIGLFIITIYPGGMKKRKLAFHYMIAYTFRFVLGLFFNVKKKIINENKENFSRPAVMVANHQSHIDLALTLQLHPKIIVFTNDWVYNSPFYGWIVKMADYYPASSGYENSLEKLKEKVSEGYSILIYPEGTRSINGEIGRFHKGAFLLAEKLQVDVLPVLIHGAGDTVTKKDFHFKDGSLTVKYLPRIKLGSTTYGVTYQERTKEICRYMREEYAKLREQCETVDYFRKRLINNYIYKGPVLEWYCRVKTHLEDNYRLFESLMPRKGKIVDVGCGYGFLPYMLMYRSSEREILGLDYDEEKINIADNCVHKSDKIKFETADVITYQFPKADGIIISDVLHYLEPGKQIDVIKKLAQSLNKNGVLVIRDADADLKSRQAGTAYTEFMSTKVLGFNKTKKSGLHFVSGKLVKETIAQFQDLQLEIIDNTKLTSNITYVVRHV